MRPVLSESSRRAQPEHRTCLVRSLPVFWIQEERCSVNPASARPQQTQVIEHDLIVLAYFGLQAHALDERHGRSTDVLAATQPHDGQPPAAGQQRMNPLRRSAQCTAQGRCTRAQHLNVLMQRCLRWLTQERGPSTSPQAQRSVTQPTPLGLATVPTGNPCARSKVRRRAESCGSRWCMPRRTQWCPELHEDRNRGGGGGKRTVSTEAVHADGDIAELAAAAEADVPQRDAALHR